MSPNLSRSLLTFAIFTLIGPAFGSVAFGILITIATQFVEPGLGLTYLFASIIFLPLAYVSGGVQAAFVGSITAFVVWRRGRTPLWLPLAAAALAATLTVMRSNEDGSVSIILFVVHMVAAACCWLILRWALNWRSA